MASALASLAHNSANGLKIVTAVGEAAWRHAESSSNGNPSGLCQTATTRTQSAQMSDPSSLKEPRRPTPPLGRALFFA